MKRQFTPLSIPCFLAMVCIAVLGTALPALGHCEIPCGIYGDRMRVDSLREHFQTLEKSMSKVLELGGAKDKNFNQLVRWVTNKDEHANKIQTIVCQYFMNQRIKPVDEGEEGYEEYVEQLTLLHQMLVSAMKCKQTTDLQQVKHLRATLDKFEKAYFEETKAHGEHMH